MKTFTLFSIFIICCIQHIIAYPQNKLPAGTIIVAQDGSGNFRTVQSAIDSLSNSASSERVIYIKNGTYKEQILCQKKYVTLVGENKDRVILTYDLNHAQTGSSSKCASFRAYGDNFKAFDITFENTAPFPGENAQAPAINCNANNHYFENCNFLSYQDTLLSNDGHHYFKNCYIRGFTDFIWGSGRAVFEQCTIHVQGKPGMTNSGYLTANGNKDVNLKKSGFLITNSKVTTDGHSSILVVCGDNIVMLFLIELNSQVIKLLEKVGSLSVKILNMHKLQKLVNINVMVQIIIPMVVLVGQLLSIVFHQLKISLEIFHMSQILFISVK